MYFKYHFISAFSVLLFLSVIPCNAQTYTLRELDSLTEKLRMEGKIQAGININKKALQEYKQQNDEEAVVAASINISELSWNINMYKESLKYLESVEDRLKKMNAPVLSARLYGEYGRNYSSLGFWDQSNSNLNTAIHFAERISDKAEKEKRLYFYYARKLYNFNKLDCKDSIRATQKKCTELPQQPLNYIFIAERFLKNKKVDSAEYYLNKASKLVGQSSLYQKSVVLSGFGKLYIVKKDYEKALDYYLQSLAVSKQIHRNVDIKTSYKAISYIYEKLNDADKKTEYLKLYSNISDSLYNAEKNAVGTFTYTILNDEKKKGETKRLKLYILISVILCAALILLIVRLKKYNKKEKRTEEIIIESKQHTEKLKSKAIEELSTLAMTNDTFFLTRFREVYTDFYNTLITGYPDLTAGDIRFCAFLRLDLTTKTIAQYQHSSVRTIESKKYRLRKKLGLPSGTDLNRWIMEL